MNAHGEILIKPCPKTGDGGNRLDFRIPDSDWFKLDLAQLLAGTHNEELCFSIVYLESVGDHPSSNASCTSLDKFSERIMLRRCRQRLEGQIQRISYAYAWILSRWFLTPLKIQDTYIIIKICPRQLPCGTQQSMSKILEKFWWMRTRWVCKERKDKILCVANNPEVGLQDFLCTHCYHGGQRGEAYLLKNLSESSSFQTQWRYDIFKHEFIMSIWLSEKGLDTFL